MWHRARVAVTPPCGCRRLHQVRPPGARGSAQARRGFHDSKTRAEVRPTYDTPRRTPRHKQQRTCSPARNREWFGWRTGSCEPWLASATGFTCGCLCGVGSPAPASAEHCCGWRLFAAGGACGDGCCWRGCARLGVVRSHGCCRDACESASVAIMDIRVARRRLIDLPALAGRMHGRALLCRAHLQYPHRLSTPIIFVGL